MNDGMSSTAYTSNINNFANTAYAMEKRRASKEGRKIDNMYAINAR